MSSKQETDSHTTVSNNVIDNLKALDIVQRERVMLSFREATLRGFDIKGIPIYIQNQIGITISIKLVQKLRRLATIQDRNWYIQYAKDQYAYIGVYRKCIDELDSLRKECWRLIMKKTTKEENKIAAMREIHNIVKTQVLLIRDLPFIMDLSKYYDPKLIEINHGKPKPILKLGLNNSTDKGDQTHPHPLNSYLHKTLYNAVNNQNLNDLPSSLPHKVLAEADARREEVFRNVDDDIMEEMTQQLEGLKESDKERLDQASKDKKAKEDEMFKASIADYENNLREEFTHSGHLSLEKVQEMQDHAESNLSYISEITTEQERESVRKLKEIRDD